MNRRGDSPTQQEQDLLATKTLLATLRDDALSKLNQLKRELAAILPKQGAQKHGQEGLAQEPKYVEEQRAGGLPIQLTDKGTPVIDAAVVGTPEVHSVKSLVPSEGTAALIRSAKRGSPRYLADRISATITRVLRNRGSYSWTRLRNQWNKTKRGVFADRFGYELPKNPDDIRFVLGVRVITAIPPSSEVRQAVEAAVTKWLGKNARVPPGFSWRIDYVPGGQADAASSDSPSLSPNSAAEPNSEPSKAPER